MGFKKKAYGLPMSLFFIHKKEMWLLKMGKITNKAAQIKNNSFEAINH